MAMNRFFIGVVLFVSTISLKSQEPVTIQPDLDEAYRKGVDLMTANRYTEALDPIFECQRSDPNNLDYANRLAYCYFQLGNYRDAKYVYKDLLLKDPLNISALSNLASIANLELNYSEARAYYGHLLEIDSTNSYYFRQNALISQKQGDLIAATALFNKAHVLNREDIATITDLATTYLELKAFDYAKEMIDKGMLQDSSNIRVLQTNARIQNELDNYPAVIQTLERAMELGDSTNYYAMMVSVAYLKTNQLDLSIYHLNRVVARKRASEHTHHYLALAYELKDDFKRAREHYQIAIEKGISKKIPRYHEDLAKLYEQSNEYYKAYDHYKTAYEYKPTDQLLFHIAHNADRYYKDKKIALRYYQKYLKTQDKKYRDYSLQRIEPLKEIIHQMKH